jgi:hypothetical protein
MSPSHNNQSATRLQSSSEVITVFAAPDEQAASLFDLRRTLAEMVVRELSFSEFRAAMEQSGRRYA